MSLKAKFFKMLGELDEVEKEQLKTFFDGDEESISETESAVEQSQETTENAVDITADEHSDNEETLPQNEDANVVEDAVANTEDMGISEQVSENEPVAEEVSHVTDDNGEELPVDYKEIIDGLNAKILALEAENSQLRVKTEGAFGFSVKPSAPTKVNPLYSDDTADIHFKK